jgi:hypothetical protein
MDTRLRMKLSAIPGVDSVPRRNVVDKVGTLDDEDDEVLAGSSGVFNDIWLLVTANSTTPTLIQPAAAARGSEVFP